MMTIVLRKLTSGPKITHRPLYPVVESIRKTINLPCHYGELFIKASIEKPLYYHDESLYRDHLPQAGEQHWTYTTTLNTNLTEHLLKHGIALDGFIRQEKNWLASSTVLNLSNNLDDCLRMMQNTNKNVTKLI
ncbi:Beta-arrestin arr-1 [Schistosoma japonicum]|nr:Beta-arrestin arr-1 [Schistosoma japonicum]